ncbi:hypothetical protein KQX54_007825 [Cotesia glomerata]|uniref:Uncharacterized protein n=1 Tax=Cotesia glomerata TaxID=32391 RepID=A0AAV7J5M5_COTGL|nr:hypothetical protein KQX54_007825 [Cotesia glomerata]
MKPNAIWPDVILRAELFFLAGDRRLSCLPTQTTAIGFPVNELRASCWVYGSTASKVSWMVSLADASVQFTKRIPDNPDYVFARYVSACHLDFSCSVLSGEPTVTYLPRGNSIVWSGNLSVQHSASGSFLKRFHSSILLLTPHQRSAITNYFL